jgi:hypothetical protein
MNARLKTLMDEAEAKLDPVAQDHLGDMVEAFVSTWNGSADFTPEELAHLATLAAEPFDAAPPEAVAAFFARP